jgi:hypothetical protein
MKVSFLINPFGPGEVKYSLFAKKVTFRGTTNGIKIESLNERWFEARMSGPDAGTFLKPFTFGRNKIIKNGVRNARNVPYGRLFTTLI